MFKLKAKQEDTIMQSQRDHLIRDMKELRLDDHMSKTYKIKSGPTISFGSQIDIGLYQLQQDISPLATKPSNSFSEECNLTPEEIDEVMPEKQERKKKVLLRGYSAGAR